MALAFFFSVFGMGISLKSIQSKPIIMSNHKNQNGSERRMREKAYAHSLISLTHSHTHTQAFVQCDTGILIITFFFSLFSFYVPHLTFSRRFAYFEEPTKTAKRISGDLESRTKDDLIGERIFVLKPNSHTICERITSNNSNIFIHLYLGQKICGRFRKTKKRYITRYSMRFVHKIWFDDKMRL